MLFDKVRDLIAKNLKLDPATILPTTEMITDLSINSLDLVELIMAFEDKFGTEISDEAAQKITTVGEAVSYIDAHKA